MKKIKLTQNKYSLVDDSDYEELNKFKWYAKKVGFIFYAYRSYKKKTISMHSYIVGTTKGMVTDHIDGNGLNNQRKNLRMCSFSQNRMNVSKTKSNRSGFKGVSWWAARKVWRAFIYHNKEQVYLGTFKTKLGAYKAYCEACPKYHGKFSNIK